MSRHLRENIFINRSDCGNREAGRGNSGLQQVDKRETYLFGGQCLEMLSLGGNDMNI